MEMNLSPQAADVTVFQGDGGSYTTWSASKSPVLSQTKLGAGKLVLHQGGFALPHYANCYKIGYVLQGSCRVGIVLPNGGVENVLTITKGDAIPVALGAVSWWYNGGDSDVEILFLGETSKSYTPAQFDYFFLTGPVGVLGGFSTEFISKAYDLGEEDSERLVKSQTAGIIVKLSEGQKLPEPSKDATNNMVYNLEGSRPQIHVNHGGSFTIATAKNIYSLKQFGLSASLVKLEANSMFAPTCTVDFSSQIFYVYEGTGRVQIVGLNGMNILDSKVQTGDLFVVPSFFAATTIADEAGLKCFSVVTSSEPSSVDFAGEKSVWKALSPLVLQTAFGVDSGLVGKIAKGEVIVPPKN